MVVAGAVVACELVARFLIGLGDPPLMMADPDIEYLFRPSASYRRFGHYLHYNAYSMRSDDFPATKSTPDEVRVLVIGDSVVNGGSPTDQGELATTLMQQELSRTLARQVTVGNVSAGSWGPPNMLAYVRRNGFFAADVVVLVLSTHDAVDVPTFEPLVGTDPDFPDHRLMLALEELLGRYLPRYLGLRRAPVPPAIDEEAARRYCLRAECDLVRAARETGASVILVQHLERRELGPPPAPDRVAIASVGARCGAEVIQLGPAFERAIAAGEEPYRDGLHPNARGQRLMASVIEPVVTAALASQRGAQGTRKRDVAR